MLSDVASAEGRLRVYEGQVEVKGLSGRIFRPAERFQLVFTHGEDGWGVRYHHFGSISDFGPRHSAPERTGVQLVDSYDRLAQHVDWTFELVFTGGRWTRFDD